MPRPATPAALTMQQRLEALTGKIRLAEIRGDDHEIRELLEQKQALITTLREAQSAGKQLTAD